MKVRGQHYIWRYYLEPWTNRGMIFCRRNDQVFETDPKNVGKQRDFYRLRELTENDILLAKLVIAQSPEHIRSLHSKLLASFDTIPKLKKLVGALGEDEDIQRALDEAITNTEELMHGRIETGAVAHLDLLRSADTAFYDDDKAAADFLHYLCVQYMRTKAVRDSVVSGMAARAIGAFADVERIWNVLSHVFAVNMGWSLYVERKLYRPVNRPGFCGGRFV